MRRLLSPGWVACHLVAAALVVGMLGMAGWQLSRATGGNLLSWGYTFQWPVFAGFVVFIWVREVRRVLRGDEPGPAAAGAHRRALASRATPSATSPADVWPAGAAGHPDPVADPPTAGRPVITRRPPPVTDPDDRDDPALAAYNRYLAWLSANPGARPVDYPG